MAIKVLIRNNPYQRKLSILINGHAVSEYSRLEKYMGMSFELMCEGILSDLYYELNRTDYILEFQARRVELDIMQKLAENDAHCLIFIPIPLEYDLPLNKRLSGLCEVINSNHLQSLPKQTHEVFVIYREMNQELLSEIASLEIKNQFCSISFNLVPYSDYSPGTYDELGTTIFLISENRMSKVLETCHRVNGFALVLGEEKGFYRKEGKLFCFGVNEDTVFQRLFDCMMFGPLLDIFRNAVEDAKVFATTPQIQRQIDRLVSTEYHVWAGIDPTTIELGRTAHLNLYTDAPGGDVNYSDYVFTYQVEGVVSVEGLSIRALGIGMTTVYMYKKGEITPCSQVDVKVIKRNRITSIVLDTNQITIGQYKKYTINYNFYPVDADNTSAIEWKSEDASIVSVDTMGEICANNVGETGIWVTAENVSERCHVQVLPNMDRIDVEREKILLETGETTEFQYCHYPRNCVDPVVYTAVMDERIAVIDQHTIYACEAGETTLVLQNESKSIRKEIPIVVKVPEVIVPVEKKGFIKRLFGG